MKKFSPKYNGFTLLEVIISFAIIMILISGIYGIMMASVKNNKSGEIKQKEALYGQKIFEDFRSKDITKTLTEDGEKYVLTFSNGLILKGNSSYIANDYDLKDGYKADIKVTRNSSTIGSGQTFQDMKSDYSYTVNLKKSDLQSAWMSDESNKDGWEQTEVNPESAAKINIEVNTNASGKTISVNVEGSHTFTKSFNYNSLTKSNDKNKEIRLSINCEDYNLKENLIRNDKGFEVHVFNHDAVPLNLCFQKTNTIYGEAVQEIGAYRLYNNRFSKEPISEGNLYDVSVKVRNINTSEDGIVFKGEISQNINIIDKTKDQGDKR